MIGRSTLAGSVRLERAAALLILALVLALLWLGPVSAYLDLVAADAATIDLDEQTLQRYRALARLPETGPAPAPAEAALLFPEIPDSQAAALLQETVKTAAAAAQIQIQGLQVLRSDPLAGAARITVRVRASGDIGSIGRLLYAIEAARPVLYPDNLQIQSRPMSIVGQAPGQSSGQTSGVTAPLDFQLDVSGFKAGASS